MYLLSVGLVLLLGGEKVLGANKCFSCSTAINPQCGDPMTVEHSNKSESLQCVNTGTNTDMICIKYAYKVGNRHIITRSCRTALDTCDDVKGGILLDNNEFIGCLICNEDLCNSTPKLGNSSAYSHKSAIFTSNLVYVLASYLLIAYLLSG